ncbi:AraC family transcriptional regulator [Neobacillus sp. CF12]|uniref:AraC family transcriptional regulator n=1 Tax=Neobacillus sp. CF12 TaxID=3055864 RepID=UPI00259FEBAF|nr:AraC family transcriptional regulator [Neobacillus sp. CF12]MDM5330566.1 AraC family transcriptional regulator [Neobacillus sp. CF12]
MLDENSLYHSKLLHDQYYPKVISYYFKQWKGFEMPYHSHNEIEIMYVIEGKCVVETATETVPMKKGDLILLDSNIAHRLVVDNENPCRMLNLEFFFTNKENEGFSPSFKEIVRTNGMLSQFLSKAYPYIVLKDSSDIYHVLKSLVLELDERSLENMVMIHLLFSQLFIKIGRLAIEYENQNSYQVNLYIKQILSFLHQNYDCEIQVKDIANVVNLHPVYLHRIFKAEMGNTLMEYLTSLRIKKAKMLLAHTEIPITEISEYVGINSRQYFSTLFKKHTGKTPIDYRNTLNK